MKPLRLGTLAVALLLAAATTAQEPVAVPFALPAGDVTLQQLVTEAGRILHWQITIDPLEVGEVQPLVLQSPIATDAAGGAEVLHALLFARELALVAAPAGKDHYEVLSLRGKRADEVYTAAPTLTAEAVLQHPRGKRVITTTLTLHNTNGTVMTAALNPVLASARGRSGSRPTNAPRLRGYGQDQVTFTGCQDQVASMVRLTQALDAPSTPAQNLASLWARTYRLEQQMAALEQQLDASTKTGGGK